jgi:hypothetical protein
VIEQRAPLTPEQAAKNRRIIVVVALVFIAVCIAVSVWGRMVVKESQAQASSTDAALRSVAWSILCYASSNDGAFPTSPAQLTAAAAKAPVATPPGGKPWPSTQDAALGGLAFVAFPAAADTIGVTWGATPDVVPNLNTKGKPSTKGTVDAVNGWLAEYARDRMRSSAPAAANDKRSDAK